ncbi:MAG: hypothetical protein LBR53_06660 [Deltaproteobacteria bacterium]|jgi:3-dehydroquinate synthetase/shikimate kinase|nr:hypothetical protein [Deltaproteobacteria bacterium]
MLSFLHPPLSGGRGAVNDSEKHVFLIGFMGSGKTTVGRLLAEILGREFLDLDAVLEKEYGKSVREVFLDKRLGEEDFRRREAKKIKALLDLNSPPKVVALGGGAVVNPQTRSALKAGGLAFYLATDDFDLLYERIKRQAGGDPGASRPLAADREACERLFKERLLVYRSQGIPVDASLPPREAALAIGSKLGRGEKKISFDRAESSGLKTFLLKEDMLKELSRAVGRHKSLVLLDHALAFERELFPSRLGEGCRVYLTRERGEAAKNLHELEAIFEELSLNSFDRSDYLIVRGGGSLSDLGALAAGLFKRGLKLILLPTTLLAAVDASVGGKTAVNYLGGKNQIGLFYLPEAVWVDGETLGTLDSRLISEGLTEAFKIGLVMNKGLSDLITRNIGLLLSAPLAGPFAESGLPLETENLFNAPPGADHDPDRILQRPRKDVPLLLEIAFRSASLKLEVVEKDYHEELGIRDVLNFGHTWGHVVESFHAGREPRVSHGRAVAHGMAVALLYSEKRQGLNQSFSAIARSMCLSLCGGEFPDDPEDLVAREFLHKDKKIRDGALKFVVLPKPFQAKLIDVRADDVVKTAAELKLEVEKGVLRAYPLP